MVKSRRYLCAACCLLFLIAGCAARQVREPPQDLRAFQSSVARGDVTAVRAGLSAHPDWAKAKDSVHGNTPLHIAAKEGWLKVAELLIAKGADVKAEDNNGVTPLHLTGDKDIAGLLIAKGADVKVRDNNGVTPLHRAALNSNEDVVELLIANGADVNVRNTEKETPLLGLAAQFGLKDIVELLISHGADVNGKDTSGTTSLHLVAVGEAGEMGKAFGLGLAGLFREGGVWVPMHFPTSAELLDTGKLLIAHGAEVNAKNSLGETPLHVAASNGLRDLAEALIAHGADVNAEDKYGWTPLQLVAEKGHQEIADLLRRHGAKE